MCLAPFLAGCSGEVPGFNLPPVARAGDDRVAQPGAVVKLDGSASYDPDGDRLSWRWELVSGPQNNDDRLIGKEQIVAGLRVDGVGVRLVRLVVDDGKLFSQPDLVQVRVLGQACQGDDECDDGLYCTLEYCEQGRCRTERRDCDDGEACTIDSCDDDDDRCVSWPKVLGADCDDGVFCNGPDVCDGSGKCVHPGDPCLFGSECQQTCNEDGKNCFDPEGTPCGDPDDSLCHHPDQCDGAGACLDNTLPDGDPCADGIFCNGLDTCQDGLCSQHAGNPCLGECLDSFDSCEAVLTGLAAGAEHTCGITAEGKAWCWGRDNYGQLGDGDDSQDSPRPIRVEADALPDNAVFEQLTAGHSHTCGLTSQKQAWCWGLNTLGQLGNPAAGDTADEPVPVDTSTLGDNTVIVQLVAGWYHTCALTAQGEAWCWGYDSEGQLGDGDPALPDNQSDVPVAVETTFMIGDRAFIQLVAGGSHTCGLTSQGRAWCWGQDEHGQLGNGWLLPDATRPSPVDTTLMIGTKTFAQLAAGENHTCGLTTAGSLWCWGWNLQGQLGSNPDVYFIIRPAPVDTSPIPGDRSFLHIVAGARHTCGLAGDGVTWCWGHDEFGQLGNGGTSSDTWLPSPVDTSAMNGDDSAFIQIAPGLSHTCGLTADWTAWCWGKDEFGQLGDGSGAQDTQSPVTVLWPD